MRSDISHLPGTERLRVFSVELTGLHVAGMSSMLLLPALIASRLALALAGAVTVLAGMLAWLLCRMRAGQSVETRSEAAAARA
ncbi:hypothetical protein ACTWPT_56410 [Nonomuraea sp. 3N208]|uniref:hypothetical protein n=1 Tax=Nonomuraea sp. 3N208 TaxID=3457421 RepID=UPI003FD1C606